MGSLLLKTQATRSVWTERINTPSVREGSSINNGWAQLIAVVNRFTMEEIGISIVVSGVQ